MRHTYAAIAAALLLSTASRVAIAQTADADAGAPPPAMYLAPRTPDGGYYAAPVAPANPPSAPSDTTPSAAPPSSAPAPSSSAPASTAPASAAPAQPTPNAGETQPAGALPPGAAPWSPPTPYAPVTPVYDLRARRAALNRERLRLLDTTLPPLASRSLHARMLDGILSLAIGTGMGVLALLVPAPTNPGDMDLRPWFWAYAGVSLAQGAITLAWTPARESLSRQYAQLPYTTPHERRQRIRFGEHAIEDMAADGTRRRILGAVAGAVVPLGLLAVMYRDQIFNGHPFNPGVFDYMIIGFAGVESIVSLLGLFGHSEEERIRDQYHQQIQMREAEIANPEPVGPMTGE